MSKRCNCGLQQEFTGKMASLRVHVFIWVAFCIVTHACGAQVEDNEFAEFEEDELAEGYGEQTDESFQGVDEKDALEEVEDDNPEEREEAQKEEDDEEAEVEVEDEYEYEEDEEFEDGSMGLRKKGGRAEDIKLSSADVQTTHRVEEYITEVLVAVGLSVYLLNYIYGRSKNAQFAQAWLDCHKKMLEQNFSRVGGKKDEVSEEGTDSDEKVEKSPLIKESDSVHSLWATGRHNCDGLLVLVKNQKRQDLLSMTLSAVTPQEDQVMLTFYLSPLDMDSFVLVIVKKKAASKMQKELNDIIHYCPQPKKGESFGLPPSFLVYSEGHETANAVLNQGFTEVFKKYEKYIQSVHITDQFTGIKDDNSEDEGVEVVVPQCRVNFTFSGTNLKAHEALTSFALHTLDRVTKLKLSKDVREKAAKARSKVAQNALKQSHAQRQEAAQAKKEEKIRQEKERLMEMDPDTARKLEAKEQKRALKKQAQKQMKMVRVG